ncbi:MAG: alpha/beta fold hydrolase [Leptolyngbyaceae bacterium]|nr:alpha/beta fold hydrolase [Leptolyngbyaceae bacterium]
MPSFQAHPERSIRRIGIIVGAIALGYLLLCVLLWRFQTRLMFFPSPHLDATPAEVGLTYTDVWLPSGGGTVHGWWIPPEAGRTNAPVVLYLHGNGSNLGDLVNRAQRFHQWGYGSFLIDYRGYGRSSGPFPNEQRVYEDAEAAWQYVTQQRQMPAQNIVLHGRSLGGAIALYLASRHPEVMGVIVESSFTSMKAMVTDQFWFLWVPVDRLLHQIFDSLSIVRSLPVPLLFIHGTADRVVPPVMSQTLYDAARAPKFLLWVEGAGHTNVPQKGGVRYAEAIIRFVERYAN